MSSPAPIAFVDESGMRWTVAVRGGDAVLGWASLEFTSDAGEHRTCECCAPDSGTWADVDDDGWRVLLNHSQVANR